MLRSIALLLLLSLSSGCSMLGGALMDAVAGGKPAIEADVNAGQAKTEGDESVAQNANTAVQVDSSQKEVYEGSVGQVVNEAGLPLHVLLLLVLLAGWAIPSPEEMAHGLIRVVRALRGKDVSRL